MDYSVLKKKLNSYKKEGALRGVSGELLVEMLRMWESYTGQMDEFAKQIGVRKSQLGPLIHKARKVAKSEGFEGGDFKEVKIQSSSPSNCSNAIVLKWEQGKVIRFSQVDQLVDFLKKVS